MLVLTVKRKKHICVCARGWNSGCGMDRMACAAIEYGMSRVQGVGGGGLLWEVVWRHKEGLKSPKDGEALDLYLFIKLLVNGAPRLETLYGMQR